VIQAAVSHTIFIWDPNIGREGLDSLARAK
jgi:hypothetical protein